VNTWASFGHFSSGLLLLPLTATSRTQWAWFEEIVMMGSASFGEMVLSDTHKYVLYTYYTHEIGIYTGI
jgi:hypothetical protein